MKRKIFSLIPLLSVAIAMVGCTIGSPEVLPNDENLQNTIVNNGNDTNGQEDPSAAASAVQAIEFEGRYIQEDQGQFDVHSLSAKAVSENELLIQLNLAEGSEAGDYAETITAQIFKYENDAWVYSSEDQNGDAVVITVDFDEDGNAVVTHENDVWEVNPDGVYYFNEEAEYDFREEAAEALVRYLPDGVREDFATENPNEEFQTDYVGENYDYFYIGAYDREINDFAGEFIVAEDLSVVIKLDITKDPEVIFGSTDMDVKEFVNSLVIQANNGGGSNENYSYTSWQDRVSGRASMTISVIDGIYYVEIYWGDSAEVTHHWSYVGTKSATNPSVIDLTGYYSIEGGPDAGLVYEDGKAALTLIDGVYYWNDMEQNKGEDCEFVMLMV